MKKKSLIAAVFTLGLTGNAFASCDSTPYVAPEELRPACVEETSVVSDALRLTTSADQVKVKVEIDSETERSAGASGTRAAKNIVPKK